MSPRRSALVVAGLLFAVALLAAASNVAGRDITYDFVDYPLSQIDSTTGRKDHVSGQVTTDGTLGVYAELTGRHQLVVYLDNGIGSHLPCPRRNIVG